MKVVWKIKNDINGPRIKGCLNKPLPLIYTIQSRAKSMLTVIPMVNCTINNNNTKINCVLHTHYYKTTFAQLVLYSTLHIQMHLHMHAFIIINIISLYSWLIDNMHILDKNIYVYLLCIYLHIYKYVLQVTYNIINTLYICYNTNEKYS